MFQPSSVSVYRYGAPAELYTDTTAAVDNGKKKKKKKARKAKSETVAESDVPDESGSASATNIPQEDNSLSLMFYVFGVGTVIVGGGVAAYYSYKKKQQVQAEQEEGEE